MLLQPTQPSCYARPSALQPRTHPSSYSPSHPPPAVHPLPYSPRRCSPRHGSDAQFFDLQLPRMLQCRLAWVLRFSVYVSPGRGSRRTSHICFRPFPLEASLERLMAPARPTQNTAAFWSPAAFWRAAGFLARRPRPPCADHRGQTPASAAM